MARPGRKKQFAHELFLSLDDEAYDFLVRMAGLTGKTKQDIARMAIHQGIEAMHGAVSEMAEQLIVEQLQKKGRDA